MNASLQYLSAMFSLYSKPTGFGPNPDPSHLYVNLRGLKPRNDPDPDRPRSIQHFLPLTDGGLDAAARTADAWKDRWDVYAGVFPRNAKRGDEDHVEWASCLYAEIDSGQDLPGMAGFPDPSVIVQSGRGLHLYQHFHRPIRLSGDARAHFHSLIRRYVNAVGGDRSVHDIARILRVPGTVNHKYDPKRPVKLIHCDLSHCRDIQWWEDHLPPLKEKPVFTPTQTRTFLTHGLPDTWIQEMQRPPEIHWNDSVIKFGVRMKMYGVPYDIIDQLLTDYTHTWRPDRDHQEQLERLLTWLRDRCDGRR